jgi:arginase
MPTTQQSIRLVAAPSILGLTPAGVQDLPQALLNAGLAGRLGYASPVIQVPTLNHLYNDQRDPDSRCINTKAIADFSITLQDRIAELLEQQCFPIVLGGDCSILLGILPALKQKGKYGLVFADAHADFYQPEKSTTGQVADMDLAIVTGHGPDKLTNIAGMKPYVQDKNVLHIGQRDQEEAAKYGSQDIRDTDIACISLAAIREKGMDYFLPAAIAHTRNNAIDKCWIHFDTDVLDDAINPAVDYRIPGGLSDDEISRLFQTLIQQENIAGMSITIFNPQLDKDGRVANTIVECIGKVFD